MASSPLGSGRTLGGGFLDNGEGGSTSPSLPGEGVRFTSQDAAFETFADAHRWQNSDDVQEALHESSRALGKRSYGASKLLCANKLALLVESQPSSPITPKRRSALDDRIADLANNLGNNLPWLAPRLGSDTLVFIDPPVYQGKLELSHNASACQHFARPFRVRSIDLEKLQSPYFTRLFQHDCQQLVRSRRGLESLPPNIKYVLDLTPKLEGDEAVRYLEDLSCPPGILRWFESLNRWQVSAMLVSGRDEFTERPISNKKRRVSEGSTDNKETSPVKTDQKVEGGEPSTSVTKAVTKSPGTVQEDQLLDPEPEYTQLRHRLAIERFLMAVSGQDPKLDSAVKVYTTVMVSKGFDIRGYNPLADYVVRWLYADPNSRFIEANPEVTLSMAEILQNESLARDAFAILVGEMVLDSASMHNSADKTCIGRRRVDIEETWQSRLEYARNSFSERVQSAFESLTGDRMDWVDELAEMKYLRAKMKGLASTCEEAYGNLSHILKDFVRGALYHTMASSFHTLEGTSDPKSTGGDTLFPKRSVADDWDEIRPQHRIYTRAFWKLLASLYIEDMHSSSEDISSDTSTNISLLHLRYRPIGVADNSRDLVGTNLYKHVKHKDVNIAIERCASLLPHSNFLPGSETYTGKTIDSSPYCKFPHCDYNKLLFTGECICCSVVYCPKHRPVTSHRCQTNFQGNLSSRHSSSASNKLATQGSSLTLRPVETDSAKSDPFWKLPAWASGFKVYGSEQASPSPHIAADGYSVTDRDTSGSTLKMSNNSQESLSDSLAEHGNTMELANQSPLQLALNDFGGYRRLEDTRSRLLSQIETHIHKVADNLLGPPEGGQLGSTIDVYLTMTVLCLGQEEAKYLPLWAGGLDDGTSGVYTTNVPFAADGFKGPPASTNELCIPGLGEDYDAMDDSKTIATSAFVNDGYGDTMHRQKVYAMSEIESVDWDFVRQDPKAQVTSAPKDDDLDIISDSGVATPTKPKASNELDALDDVFMETSDEEEGFDDFDSDGDVSEREYVLDEVTSKKSDDTPNSYVLETESVSYGGFSEPDSSSFGGIATPTHTSGSPEPENVRPDTRNDDPAQSIPGDKAKGKRPVANDIGSELKSRYANVYYIYKDGPEDDPLLSRP